MISLKSASLEWFTDKPDGLASQRELRRRIRLLEPHDRMLIEVALDRTMSRRQLGTMLGMAPGSVSRRVRRIINRLRDPLVISLTDPDCPLSREHLQIALEYFLLDKPVIQLARARNAPQHQIRAMLDYVRGWHRGLSAVSTKAQD